MSPLDSVVILDGAPVVGTDKAERLLKAISKSASKEASLSLSPQQIEMPTDQDGNSKGFMFVSLENPTEALAFQRAMHGLAFDKRHTFSVVPFSEVESYQSLEQEYKEPEEEEWAPRVSSSRILSFLYFSPTLRVSSDRSTSVHGSQIPLVVINSFCTKETTSALRGLERPASLKPLTSEPSVCLSTRVISPTCADTFDFFFGAAIRNGPISSRSGRPKELTSRRSIFRVSRCGEVPRSRGSTDSRTPRSS